MSFASISRVLRRRQLYNLFCFSSSYEIPHEYAAVCKTC